MAEVVAERVVSCRSDVCSLWNVLTDTERMNRAVGMDRVALEPLSDGSAARFLATTELGGFQVQYEERPYEWVYLESFKVFRKMRSGPAESLEMSYRLEPAPSGGTNVTMRLTIAPRWRVLSPVMRLRSGQSLRKFEDEILRIDESLAKGARPPPPRGQVSLRPGAIERVAAELAKGEAPALAERLLALVREGSDLEVTRIRPYALADEWSVPRHDVLAACLRAVRAGLVDLRWEVVCPSCRTATESLPTLAELGDHGACQLCELEFAVDLDESVEATFAANAAVRETDKGPYCIGGPARTPHVVAQAILPAGGRGRLVVPAEEGHYRLFVRGGAATAVDVQAGGAAEVALDGVAAGAGERIVVRPGGAISVGNAGAEERHAKLERATWSRQAATAREVTCMPAFRRDFSADVLRPGTALKVARVGLFFSDLTGSTALYSGVGDASAFRLVQDHFDVVIGLVEANKGTLVKTIGDAVMAVFADEVDGVAASVAILRAFEEFRAADSVRQRTHIKLGVFGGPCYVVTANKILDYFGQTVNMAARLQGEAASGELVIEGELADRAIRQGRLEPELVRERYRAKLKGIEEPVEVARIRVGSAG